jgi:hypothetical protein
VHLINHDKTIMIHLCINSPLHHIYINYASCINDNSLTHLHQGHHINDPCLSIGFHLDIYHSHQGHNINDPYLSIGFHLDIYHSHQGHHINDPSLSIGFHLDIYHSHQGHHINDPSLSIGFHLDIYHSHQCIYIVHQSINYLTSINDINQTKPFSSMTYDPTISQIIKPLASMTT